MQIKVLIKVSSINALHPAQPGLTHLLQCIGISGAGVQDVDPEGHPRQQSVVHIDSVYSKQHGL